jgi:hypothetical protein
MAIVQGGKTPLQKLKSFRSKKWFRKDFETFAERVAVNYANRSEITEGGIVTDGSSLSLTALKMDVTAMKGVLAGRTFTIAALSDTDLLVDSGAVGPAIWANGAAEGDESITLAAATGAVATIAFVTLIVTNSTGGGGVDEDDDNACGQIVAVIACSASSDEGSEDYTDASDFLNSKQIQAALDASDEHDALTGWIHLAEVKWNCGGDGAIDACDREMNRNNVVAGA